MPVLLDPEGVKAWLKPSLKPAEARELLRPAADDMLLVHEASRAVNSRRNEGPSLIDPAPNSA